MIISIRSLDTQSQPVIESAVTEADLNTWYDKLESTWISQIALPNSPEKNLEELEPKWEVKREYYNDRYLYTDRF